MNSFTDVAVDGIERTDQIPFMNVIARIRQRGLTNGDILALIDCNCRNHGGYRERCTGGKPYSDRDGKLPPFHNDKHFGCRVVDYNGGTL